MEKLKIRRIILDSGYGITIAYTEDLEIGMYNCAFSFLNKEDQHCKKTGREIAISNYRKGITYLISGDLNIEDGGINEVGTACFINLWALYHSIGISQIQITEKETHLPRFLFDFLFAWGEEIFDRKAASCLGEVCF